PDFPAKDSTAIIDASAETDGSYNFTLDGNQPFTVEGGAGNDKMHFRENPLTADDKVDGGAGHDTVIFDQGVDATLLPETLQNIETLIVEPSLNASSLTTVDETVAAGATLKIVINSDNTFTFDGSAETDGKFNIVGSYAGDTITGGARADVICGNPGGDFL